MLAVFPDARFVMTHRDPAAVLGSVCSLIATMHELTGQPPDPAALGRAELAPGPEAMRRLLAVRARVGESRFADVHFHELVADPVGAIARAYEQLGLPFTAEAERRIAAHAAANPRGRHGEHRYRLEDWGLDRAGVHAAFRSTPIGAASRARSSGDDRARQVLSGAAWAEFCDALKEVGELVQDPRAPAIRSTAPRATAS